MRIDETLLSETLDLGELDFDEFEAYWQIYPRRRDRRRAEGAFARARKVASFDEIMAAAHAYAAEVEGLPVDRIRWPNEWLRSEPWRPEVPPVTPRPAPRRRRRADPSKPRRSPHRTSRARLTAKEQWCQDRGITVREYEARKDDAAWLEMMKRRHPAC